MSMSMGTATVATTAAAASSTAMSMGGMGGGSSCKISVRQLSPLNTRAQKLIRPANRCYGTGILLTPVILPQADPKVNSNPNI
jgi:hypothetical protein